MQTNHTNTAGQLGFDDLLSAADADNRQHAFERQAAHLPDTMDLAVPFLRALIDQHHDAMLDNDFETAINLRKDADLLARKLDHDGHGILAHDDAPGYVLARETAAARGSVPLWGQEGLFRIQAAGMVLDVTMQGIFGIGSTAMPYLGFEARAVHHNRPFLSPTGYRSFLGVSVAPKPGMDVEAFVHRIIEIYVRNECKGRLVSIGKKYRKTGGEKA